MSGSCSDFSSAVTDDTMKFSHPIFFLLLVLNASITTAQQGGSIIATTDKNRILIGEPLLLAVEVKFNKKEDFKALPVDSIPHFESLEEPVFDTIRNDGALIVRGSYKLTSFDSGHWVIPSFSLSRTVKTDTIGIDVVFSEFDPNKDYHDIKEIIAVDVTNKKTFWWWYVAGGLLLLGLILWLFLKGKTPKTEVKPSPVTDPYEEAMLQLEKLTKGKAGSKEFHSSLTDIFRLYIFRRKGILSLQKTTDDLVIQLKELKIDKENFEKLSQSLRLSDFVKFAKYSSSAEDDSQCLLIIKNIIRQIEKSGSPV